MSALGHKRTFAVQKVMSALPPKADICLACRKMSPQYVQVWSHHWSYELTKCQPVAEAVLFFN